MPDEDPVKPADARERRRRAARARWERLKSTPEGRAQLEKRNAAKRRRHQERMNDPAYREHLAEVRREWLANPENAERQRAAVRKSMAARRADDPAFVADQARQHQERMADPVYREARRTSAAMRRLDPEVHLRRLERQRARNDARLLPPADHPGTCDCCGRVPPSRKGGRSGLVQDHRHDTGEIRGWLCTRCNTLVAAFDLGFSDPELFAALKAWSLKGAPVVPVKTRSGTRRTLKPPERGLFG